MTYYLVCRLFLCLIKYVTNALFHSFYFIHCIPQLQNFCLVLLPDFYLFAELFTLFLHCFLDFIELSMLSYISLSFLKTILLNYLSSNM